MREFKDESKKVMDVVTEEKTPVEKTEEKAEEKKPEVFHRPVKETPKEGPARKYIVKPMRLNVRQEPSEASAIVGTVSAGDILTIKESSSVNPSWKKVVDPVNGYVVAAFIDIKR